MAFGNGMGSPEELAMKIRELAGSLKPPDASANPVGIGMNTGGPQGRSMPGMATPGLGPYSRQGIGTDKAALEQTGGDPYAKPPSTGGIAASPSLPPRGGPSPQAGPSGQAMYQVNGADGPKHIPRDMVEQWINGDAATRKRIESMNPANR